jgi:hypothetical protein
VPPCLFPLRDWHQCAKSQGVWGRIPQGLRTSRARHPPVITALHDRLAVTVSITGSLAAVLVVRGCTPKHPFVNTSAYGQHSGHADRARSISLRPPRGRGSSQSLGRSASRSSFSFEHRVHLQTQTDLSARGTDGPHTPWWATLLGQGCGAAIPPMQPHETCYRFPQLRPNLRDQRSSRHGGLRRLGPSLVLPARATRHIVLLLAQ